MLIQSVLYSPSHMLQNIEIFFFIFKSLCFSFCFRIQSNFHRYFLSYNRRKNRKYLLKIYLMKINGSFRSYINPLYLHETGPKSCTFTYLYVRWGNRIIWIDQRMTFFLLPRKCRKKTGLFVPIYWKKHFIIN